MRNGTGIENRRHLRQSDRVKALNYLLLTFVIAVLVGCGHAHPPAAPSVDDLLPTKAQPKLRTMKIYVGAEVLDAELALNDKEEMTGMMFRTNILETDAMLFVLPYTQRANFWMKNCPESISAAYINANGNIEEIHHLEQNDTNGVRSASENIRFVLETREGWFTRHNITPGTSISTEKGSLAEVFLQHRQ